MIYKAPLYIEGFFFNINAIFEKNHIMSSKFFGNSKVKDPQGQKNKKTITPRAVKRTTAVRKTGRGK